MKFLALLSFESARYFKVTSYFTVTWIFLIFLFMSFFESIKGSSEQLAEIYKTMPPELLDVFGKGLDSLANVHSYFINQIMLYLLLSGCIFFVFITANSLSTAITNRNILFLLSKPVGRFKIYYAKVLALIINLVISNAILLSSSLIAISITTQEKNYDTAYFVLAFFVLTITEFFFIALTEALGAKYSSNKAIALASVYVIIGYLISVLTGLAKEAEFLKYLSPNYYTDLAFVSDTRGLRPEILLLIVLSLVLIALGWYFFQKRAIDD